MERPIITCDFTGSKGEAYTTSIYETFDECNCKGFTYRRTCKHVKKLKQYLSLTQ